MSVDVIKNMGHSVNARLKHIATVRKVSFDFFLRYAYERFLYRLGQSVHASRFVLKGASAFSVYKCDGAGGRNRKVRHAFENKEKDTTL